MVKAHIPGLGTAVFPSQEAADKALAELDQLWTANPLHRFRPHPKQVPFLASTDAVKAFLGGNRSGKTTAGIVDDLIQAVDREALPEHLRHFKRWEPPFNCRIVAPDFISTMEGVILHKLREWAPKDQLLGGGWDKAYDKQRRLLRFKNGSVFSFMTFEQDLDKFGGWSGQRVHYDEEPPRNIRTECFRGLVDHGGDELFTMTPLQGMTWMYDEIYERRYEDNVTVVQVTTDDNPHLNTETLEAFFASLTPEERQARREGKFVHFGGLVLAGWRDELHLADPILPEHLKGKDVYVGIDPGVARGGVVWAAFDRDNHMLIFDELYPSNQTVAQIAKDIKAKNEFWELDPRKIVYVIDPSARNRSLTNAESPESEFAQEGIYCIHGQNSRRAGVMQLRRRLEAKSLVVTRNCKNTLWERGRWRVAEDEESSQDKAKRNDADGDTFATEGPDHTWDPARYIAMERLWGPWDLPGESRRRRPRFQPGVAPPASQLLPLAPRAVGPMGPMS